jgi:hypothetical protein
MGFQGEIAWAGGFAIRRNITKACRLSPLARLPDFDYAATGKRATGNGPTFF